MHILYLSSWLPFPPDNGTKLRTYNLLKGLAAASHTVSLIAFSDRRDDVIAGELASICANISIVPKPAYHPNSLSALAGFFRSTPRYLLDTYTPDFAQAIQSVLQKNKVDLVIASEWTTAVYWKLFQHLPSILEDPEIGIFESKIRQSQSLPVRLRHALTLWKFQYYLRSLLPKFHTCVVVSDVEKKLFQQLVPSYDSIEIIPNCVAIEEYPQNVQTYVPNSIIYTGSFGYSANYDAMLWFLSEVYPLIKSCIPGANLTITGDHRNLPLPAAEDVHLTGHVPEIKGLVASSAVSIVPLRLGGGTRLKILEAMALRTPIVSTSKGAEGLKVRHLENILIADDAQSFAQAVVTLLTNAQLRETIAANGHRLVAEEYTWSVIMPKFIDIVNDCSPAK